MLVPSVLTCVLKCGARCSDTSSCVMCVAGLHPSIDMYQVISLYSFTRFNFGPKKRLQACWLVLFHEVTVGPPGDTPEMERGSGVDQKV